MEINNVEYLQDSRGAYIPRAMVKEIDILRDHLVMEIVKKAEAMNLSIAEFKRETMADIEAFADLSAERFNVKTGGTKGNISLFSYDGRYKVTRSVAEYMVFDERLQVAKTLIDECVKEWTGGSSDEIKALINHAFQVDKSGKISTERILGLRRLNIEHPGWKKAMEAISESIQITGSKEYVRVYKRDEVGKYQLVNLDLAAI